MAHLKHYKMKDVKRIIKEYYREHGYNNNDKRVDVNRSKNNYQIYYGDNKKFGSVDIKNELDYKLSKLAHSKRRDLNVMSSWVVSLPKDELFESDEAKKRFFEEVFNFVASRYGKNSILGGGYLHSDEANFHIHIPIIPIKDGRVSSKALFTRTELCNFHTDLDRHIEKCFGKSALIKNGRTKGNYTIKELKQRTADERHLKEKETHLSALHEEHNIKVRQDYMELETRKEDLSIELENLDVQKNTFKEKIKSITFKLQDFLRKQITAVSSDDEYIARNSQKVDVIKNPLSLLEYIIDFFNIREQQLERIRQAMEVQQRLIDKLLLDEDRIRESLAADEAFLKILDKYKKQNVKFAQAQQKFGHLEKHDNPSKSLSI